MANSKRKEVESRRVGTIFDNYRIVELIGRGGMGTVYRAIHMWTQREVALKFMHEHLAQDEASIRRFMKEARAAASLRHPSVVDILHMGQHQGEVYMVLEFLRGCSLRSWLKLRGVLSLQETFALLAPPMEALSEAHRRGLIHRDIKPDNVFLAAGRGGYWEAKLLDFGVAKLLGPGTDPSMTATGALLGTPQYMAPEQANSEPDVGPAVDVWAMGMVFYECLSGRLPFADCTSLPTLLLRLVSEDVPPLTDWAPQLSAAQAETIQRALRRERSERFATMEEMLHAMQRVCPSAAPLACDLSVLDTVRASAPPEASSPPGESLSEALAPDSHLRSKIRRRSPRILTSASVALLALVIATWLVLEALQKPTPAPDAAERPERPGPLEHATPRPPPQVTPDVPGPTPSPPAPFAADIKAATNPPATAPPTALPSPKPPAPGAVKQAKTGSAAPPLGEASSPSRRSPAAPAQSAAQAQAPQPAPQRPAAQGAPPRDDPATGRLPTHPPGADPRPATLTRPPPAVGDRAPATPDRPGAPSTGAVPKVIEEF